MMLWQTLPQKPKSALLICQMHKAMQRVLDARASEDWSQARAILSSDCVFHSSAHGYVRGIQAISAMLHQDHLGHVDFILNSTNYYAAGIGRDCAASAYVIGE